MKLQGPSIGKGVAILRRRLRGLHIKGVGDAITRVGLTVQQASGMPVEAWGLDAMRTTRPVSEILV